MTTERTDYRALALSDARDMLVNFVDELCEQWERDANLSDDFNNDIDGGDEYHHSTHVDKDYDLLDAAELLDQLSEFEETDRGLWEGQDPRRAIATQAAFTYGNAVASMWSDIISDLNDDLSDLARDIDAAQPEDADPDATEAAVREAGARYIRLYAELVEHESGDCDGMIGAALDGAAMGDYTAALALADWLAEHDQDRKAQAVRGAVA